MFSFAIDLLGLAAFGLCLKLPGQNRRPRTRLARIKAAIGGSPHEGVVHTRRAVGFF